MDVSFSQSHQQFAVQIEPKPGGGFVSSSDNPALVFEGATKEEVQQKVLQKILELGGPDLSRMVRDAASNADGENKISVTVNKSFSIGRSETEAGEPTFQLKLSSRDSTPAGLSAEIGLSPLAKAAIIIAALLLLLWFVFRS